MSHEQDLLSLMGHMAGMHSEAALQFRHAEVTKYDAVNNTVVVKFMPEQVPSGDIPVYTLWGGTPGTPSGMQIGIEPGTLMLIFAFDKNWEHLGALLTSYSDKNRPPGAPAGEVWWFHKTGSYVKMKVNGDLLFSSPTQILAAAPLIQLSDSLAALSDGNSVVRKSDLQAVVDSINAFISTFNGHDHIGNMGSPTSPPVVPQTNAAAATASSIAKAK